MYYLNCLFLPSYSFFFFLPSFLLFHPVFSKPTGRVYKKATVWQLIWGAFYRLCISVLIGRATDLIYFNINIVVLSPPTAYLFLCPTFCPAWQIVGLPASLSTVQWTPCSEFSPFTTSCSLFVQISVYWMQELAGDVHILLFCKHQNEGGCEFAYSPPLNKTSKVRFLFVKIKAYLPQNYYLREVGYESSMQTHVPPIYTFTLYSFQ